MPNLERIRKMSNVFHALSLLLLLILIFIYPHSQLVFSLFIMGYFLFTFFGVITVWRTYRKRIKDYEHFKIFGCRPDDPDNESYSHRRYNNTAIKGNPVKDIFRRKKHIEDGWPQSEEYHSNSWQVFIYAHILTKPLSIFFRECIDFLDTPPSKTHVCDDKD